MPGKRAKQNGSVEGRSDRPLYKNELFYYGRRPVINQPDDRFFRASAEVTTATAELTGIALPSDGCCRGLRQRVNVCVKIRMGVKALVGTGCV